MKGMLVHLGDSGLNAYGGYVNEEFLRDLQGSNGRKKFREMAENDPTIGAVLFAITSLVCGVETTITAADDTPEGENAKKFVEDALSDMDTPIGDVMTETCTMFTYGFAPMEVAFKRCQGESADPLKTSKFDDGRIGIASIELRPQSSLERWDFDQQNGRLRGMWQTTTWKPSTVFIPIDKIALFRTQSVKSNPEGASLLRRLYRAWYFKVKIEEIEAIGVERGLAGLPVIRIPNQYFDPNGAPEDIAVFNSYKQLVTQIRIDQNGGVLLPSDPWMDDAGKPIAARKFEFELLAPGNARPVDTTAIIDRYNKLIATAVLMDFLFLGQGSVGSFALSSDKTALFAQALGVFLRRIEDVWNRKIIKPLWDLNGFDPAVMPKFALGDLEKPDLAELAGFLSSLAGMGMPFFPDRELENYFRKLVGLPMAPEEDELGPQGAPGEGEEGEEDEEGGDWELPKGYGANGAPQDYAPARDPLYAVKKGRGVRAADALARVKALLDA